MIAEGFAAIGARTTLLPGGEVFSALEKGTVDAADYTGPAVNWDLGFQQVTNYIWTGPAGLESIYQPVDLMDFCVAWTCWNKLSPKMKAWLDYEIQAYSDIHHAAIQKADMETWPKFEKAGTKINRLPAEDLAEIPARRGAHLVQVGEQGQGRGQALQAPARGHGVADGGLRDARHVQGPEAQSCRLERPGGPVPPAVSSRGGAVMPLPAGHSHARRRLTQNGGFGAMPTPEFCPSPLDVLGRLLSVPGRRDVPGRRELRHGAPRSRSSSSPTSSGSPPASWACTAFTSRSAGASSSSRSSRRDPTATGGRRDRRDDMSRTSRPASQAQTAAKQDRADQTRQAARRPKRRPAWPRRGPTRRRPRRTPGAKAVLDGWYDCRAASASLIAHAAPVDAFLIPGIVRRMTRARRRGRGDRGHGAASAAPAGSPRAGHARGSDARPAHAGSPTPSNGSTRMRRRIRRLLGGDLRLRLLLRGLRALPFNSPTNWVHESMFLMYGMQYMISGAYAYKCRPARAGRRRSTCTSRARQSHRRHLLLGVLLHLHFTMLVTGWRFAHGRRAIHGTGESRSPNGPCSTGR